MGPRKRAHPLARASSAISPETVENLWPSAHCLKMEPSRISRHPFPERQTLNNRLLLSLPDQDLQLVGRFLEPVDLRRGQVLQERNRAPKHAYFIEAGAASLFLRTKRDGLVGVSVIARYGLVGLPIVLGTTTSPHRCVVQIPGRALRISAANLQFVLSQSPALQQLLNRSFQALLIQHGQRILCASRHKLEQQLSSWLLAMSDRLESDHIEITHELVSQMLGVRRASVTIAARRLEEIGALSGGRGFLEIVDRAKLEAAGCECYKGITQEYARLLDNSDFCAAAGHPAPLPLSSPPPASKEIETLDGIG
jgi:CRP-like cAMP-binding protein